MTDRLITHLRHISLAVPDLATERAFYTGLWGLPIVAEDSSVVHLAAEESPEPFIVRLRQADAKRIDLIGFGAADTAAVDQLAEQLGRSGVKLVASPDHLDAPGGGYGVRFFDGEGRTIEVSAAVENRATRPLEPTESVPARLSHIVVNSAEPEATVAWYVEHLGFAISDVLMAPHMGSMMWFLRCNSQHHSLAIARCPHASLHHASFEVRGIDEFMRATGRLLRAGADKLWGPGRHLAGNNTFAYFLDPLGNTIEYTTEMERLDEATWEPHEYDFTDPNVSDQWGTANQMSQEIAMRSFNDPDRGLFVAPPV